MEVLMVGSAMTAFSRRDFDWVVVGAGLTGSTLAERVASQLGQRVLVIDRRPHVAGNAYDSPDQAGTLVHRYGAHIFHTKSQTVWRYLSNFTSWRSYEHRVLACIEGKLVPLPFNLNTLAALFPRARAQAWEAALVKEFGDGSRVPVLKLLEHPRGDLASLGRYVYETFFLHYTEKQWGVRPEALDPAVTSRVPVIVGTDNRYFRDPYQGIPTHGYTAMVTKMLSHPLITVALSTPYEEVRHRYPRARTIYTGAIDEFFGGAHGPLPYRSLRFEHHEVASGRSQPVAVVNYPNDFQYTRVIEHCHFHGTSPDQSTVTYEFPEPYLQGRNEPYYPLPTPASHQLYSKYRAETSRHLGKVFFVGRLANYRYFDMDQAVNQALLLFKRHLLWKDQLPMPA
jgi:UDP-galactopyranose mutase